MARHTRALAFGALLLTLSACSDPTLAGTQKKTRSGNMTVEGCELTPSCSGGGEGGGGGGGGGGGNPGGGTTNVDSITEWPTPLQLPPDPSPGANGIWIGYTSHDCYINYSSAPASPMDVDQDMMNDDCEYRLAKAFAPLIFMSSTEPCPYGEPYWAVRYFDDSWGYGWGQFVRIAYLPGWYRDCDPSGYDSHYGDSEFIMLQVGYNSQTHHWELYRGYLSAHAVEASDPSGALSNSVTWPTTADFDFPNGHSQTYPRIYVARGKHANYYNGSKCEDGGLGSGFLHGIFGGTDTCRDNFDAGRFRVWQSHNIGGFNYHWADCVASQNPDYYLNGRSECYWTVRAFKGWQLTSEQGVTPYGNFLMSGAFECWLYDSQHCYYQTW